MTRTQFISMLYKQVRQEFTRIITAREELPEVSEYKRARCPVWGKTGYLNRDWEEVPEEVVYGKVS